MTPPRHGARCAHSARRAADPASRSAAVERAPRRARLAAAGLGVAAALCLGIAALGGRALPRVTADGPDLAPAKGFRVRLGPEAIGASADAERARKLRGLGAAGDASWPAEGALGRAELELLLPDDATRGGALVVLDVERVPNGETAVTLEAGPRPAKRLRALRQELFPEPARRLVHLAVPRGQRALRVVLGGDAGSDRPVPRLHAVKLFRLDPRGRNDYWVFLGASLTAGAIKPDAFEEQLAASYPGYTPYVANEAVSGWSAARLRRELPAILERHALARYVAIHIGGNDVSAHRPHPGGAQALEADLTAILSAIVAAGKVPMLSRLSYRAYPEKDGKPAVPPEANGSGPYVERIFDPLIARYCPVFFDRAARRGAIDLYGYFREHPDELGGDGIHLSAKGAKSFARIWAEAAGGAIYRE